MSVAPFCRKAKITGMSSFLCLLLSFLMLVQFVSAQNITVNWLGGWSCELEFQGHVYPCSLGKNGATADKKEGDGKTPFGTFQLRTAFYRKDKTGSVNCLNAAEFLKCEETQENFGWVDDPTDPLYNQFTYLPYPASHEELFLKDSVAYDLMAVIGYNDNPVVPYKGSAIFFHVTNTYGGTAGCVAVSLTDLQTILSRVTESSWMIITEK
jgi:L,D-peptidoglycan transpeptidase YkuD (ErfK/YbiS/YcfS/YnhG family)